MPVKTGIHVVGARRMDTGLRRYDEFNDVHLVDKVKGSWLLRWVFSNESF